MDALYAEAQNIQDKQSEEYSSKVQQYNAKVKENNEKIAELNNEIKRYDKLVSYPNLFLNHKYH